MKNIVAYDIETTGLDTSQDQIIQLSGVKFNPENFEILGEYNKYIRPDELYEITEGAFEKHGITKEFLEANGSHITEVAPEFLSFIEGCDLLSYNGNSFDIKILTKDFAKIGIEFDLNKVFYDSMLLEAKLFPRKLDAIYKKYTGKDLEGAHNSLNDVYATIEVFHHQVAHYQYEGITLDDIMEFDESKIFCVDGMIKKVGENIHFAKGKYRELEFMNVAKKDPSYIKWFMTNPDFSNHTKNILRKYYKERR